MTKAAQLGAAGPTLGRRNLLINGCMRINQRGVETTTVHSEFASDRWSLEMTGLSALLGWASNGGDSAYGNPHSYLRCSAVGAPAAGSLVIMRQSIEGNNSRRLGWGTDKAKWATLSFRARAVSPLALPYTFSVVIRYKGSDYSFVSTCTLTDYSPKDFVIKIPPLTAAMGAPAPELGSGLGFDVNFTFAASTSGTFTTPTKDAWVAGNFIAHSSQSNGCATLNGALNLSDVQLEEGDEATPFEFRSVSEEQSLCERYFQWVPFSMGFSAASNNFSQMGIVIYRTRMRAAPTGGPLVVDPETTQSAGLNGGNIFFGPTTSYIRTQLTSNGAGWCTVSGYRASLSAEL
jgi:hypothetical protein